MPRYRKVCAKCHKNRVKHGGPSYDYCTDCYKSIKHRLENPMMYARAAGALVKASQNWNADYNRRNNMAAFMAVFHPNYPDAKLRKLLADNPDE